MYDRSLGDDDDKDEEVEEDAMFQSSHVRSAGEGKQQQMRRRFFEWTMLIKREFYEWEFLRLDENSPVNGF